MGVKQKNQLEEEDQHRPTRREDLLRLVVLQDQFHLESYYDALKDWTFPSTWFDLPLEQAKALELGRARRVRSLPEDPILSLLASRIDQAIQQMGGCAVVRLSTRSPKDIVLQRECTKSFFLQQDEQLRALHPHLREDVRQMISLTRAAGYSMAVRSGREAVDMLIESQRTFDDLRTACASTPPSILRVIVRKFIPIEFEVEMRVFVNQKKVSAISQYYASLYVPWLHEHKLVYQKKVFDAVEKINELIEMEEYVIDFALESGRLWVVELNLPPPVSGMSMFDKHNPEDLKIVRGEGPFEFRVAELTDEDCRHKNQLFFQSLAPNTSALPPSIHSANEQPRSLRRSF